MPDVQRYLREKEKESLERARAAIDGNNPTIMMFGARLQRALHDLSACRALLKKHEYADQDTFEEPFCPECGGHKKKGHKPDCAWRQAIEGSGVEPTFSASNARGLALLRKHQWGGYESSDMTPRCPECHNEPRDGHAPDCAIAAQLAG